MKITNSPPVHTPPPSGLSKEDDAALRKVSKQFEGVFVNQLVGAMRKTISKGGLIKESQAERVFQGMLDAEHAQAISDADQLGLSNVIYEHLLRTTTGR